MSDIKIRLTDVLKKYDGKPVLDNIGIEVRDGEIVSIIGPSGCGKSTIFNLISGIVDIDSGKVEVNGKISYMYQKDLLLPYKKIIDNVSLPLIIRSMSKIQARDKVKPYFKIFGLEGYEEKYPRELSGGMKQRANFLRTYVDSNDIMLLDEPFGALDSITKISLQNWFLDVRKQVKSTILMITHDIDEAMRLSDRIYVLSNKPARVLDIVDLGKYRDTDGKKIDIEEIKNHIIKLLV